MELSCIHCGQGFSITADQLGGRGRCPHCRGAIQLPRADEDAIEESGLTHPAHWLENSVSFLGSMVFHMVLVIVLTCIPQGQEGLPGNTEQVMIGNLPDVQLSEPSDEQLTQTENTQHQRQPESLDQLEQLEPPSADLTDTESLEDLNPTAVSMSGAGTFSDLGAVSVSSMSGKGDWSGMIQRLRRHGLDVVLAFDSTASMGGEIYQVKSHIDRIGNALIKLVPGTRISICTYRDHGDDDYLVRGLPLTSDLQKVQSYLDEISTSGGGDHEEAVQEGLYWSIHNNQFRPNARKVILIFGDAPPHQQDMEQCGQLAKEFKNQHRGVVSTVTCRVSSGHLPEFVEIAQMGGGEAFLTSDVRQIMTQLMVLVFGSEYRGKVVEAFRLLDG